MIEPKGFLRETTDHELVKLVREISVWSKEQGSLLRSEIAERAASRLEELLPPQT